MTTTITPRQLEYARAWLAGEPRRSVAARLGVAVSTVDHMTRRVRRMFGPDRATMQWHVATARVMDNHGGLRSTTGLRPGDPVEIIGGRFSGRRGDYAGSANSTQVRVRIGGGTFAVRRRFVHRDAA